MFSQTLGRLSAQQKMGLGVALAALIALSVGLWLWGSTPEYRVLYSNLNDKDGGAIIDSLQQMNIPYKFSEGGGVLMVPAGQVHEARLHLAAQGLPKGGTVGFELMENQKFGTSEFLEQVNYLRAMEGELARSVQTLGPVQAARIHLAIPKPTVFVKEQQSPGASVVLSLYPGRALDAGQVSAIVHLVSSSVPGMIPKNVTVVDQNGTLLSAPPENGGLMLDASQLKYVHQIESDYGKRIEDMVAPLLGAKNVHAQVTADVDFTQSEQTAETYKPNQPPNPATVQSQQTQESSSQNGNGPSGGVPGALSNQPPVPATAPLTAPPPAAAAAAGVAGRPAAPGSSTAAAVPASNTQVQSDSRRETTTNYDVDRTISHTRLPVGGVRRLSVAVLVNNMTVTDKAGKVSTRPLSAAEKAQITTLVKDAVGFDEKRGDTLSLLNSPFDDQKEVIPEVPLWKQPQTIELAKEALKYVAILGVSLFLILGFIRPALRNWNRAMLAAAEAERNQREQEDLMSPMDQPPSSQSHVFEHNLGTARQMAQQDPRVVASVVKEWVSGNE